MVRITIKKVKVYRKNEYFYVVTLRYKGTGPKTSWIKPMYKYQTTADYKSTPQVFKKQWGFATKSEAQKVARQLKKMSE